ncbi:hypothetical protein E2605_14905 [Dysgonomonas capnocytophagoides]|uniref:DNA packaging protein n=1 Tax=Dysgonomonas capnocytophagoides TaxID=45254 RepID=A0A4Y8KYC5_9BACT|nr:terminase small subunit [Dysgonomonas capnocytophagoides]TFD94659.1 hypothetical protein E2605_14905 [Dysgonomonas capnocytophagoides]
MAAPKGNKFYKKREKNGRELEYKTPEDFLREAYKYFDWCTKTPWIKKDFIKSGDFAGQIVDIPTSRPYTIDGLCNYLGIDVKTFYNYEERKDFFQVITYVRGIIRQNQIEGACVGAYNSSIVARILGLANKQEIETTGGLNITVTSDKAKESIEKLQEKLQNP